MAKKKAPRRSEGMTTRAFRMSEEYAAWLERAAAHDRSTIAAFLDRAAAAYARSIGFGEGPPDRNG